MGVRGTKASTSDLFRIFLTDDSGQAITEYILILSLALGGAIALGKILLAGLDKFTVVFGAQLEKDLKTGRADANPGVVWSN